MKVTAVVGARPNLVKIAPLMQQFQNYTDIKVTLLHTGQHYDHQLSRVFFDDLGISQPDIYLGIGSGDHGRQIGKIMIEFEKTITQYKPDLVLVVGDVNSTIACGMVAVKHGIKLAHVEAGLRSFDRTMPEEINRILTDQISDLLFTSEPSGSDNLAREGIPSDKIFFVGNVMIDSLHSHLTRAKESAILEELQLTPQHYAVLTLHRPSNVDSAEQFTGILNAVEEIQNHLPIVFSIHPRSRERLERFQLWSRLQETPNLLVQKPLGYLDFLKLICDAKFVLTDSGGIQEETTVLGIPCLTLRDNTERPITVTQGTNTVVGNDTQRIIGESERILQGQFKKGRTPDLWDGKTARRIIDVITTHR